MLHISGASIASKKAVLKPKIMPRQTNLLPNSSSNREWGRELCSINMLPISSSHSCDQAILWLPDASEASHPAHYGPSAAGLHAGRAQAQAFELLAEHQQADTLPEMRAARVCAWTPSEKALYPSGLGGRAQLLSILCLQRMAHTLLPSLFKLQTDCRGWDTCRDVCVGASPIEPALHSAQGADFQEELTSSCQL